MLREKANAAKNNDETSTYKSPEFYPANGSHVYTGKGGAGVGGPLPGAVVPKGFQHYSHCSCYGINEKHPKPTLELAEIEMMSE